MKATINIAPSALEESGFTVEQFEEAVGSALSKLVCPTTGKTMNFIVVQVEVITDYPRVALEEPEDVAFDVTSICSTGSHNRNNTIGQLRKLDVGTVHLGLHLHRT